MKFRNVVMLGMIACGAAALYDKDLLVVVIVTGGGCIFYMLHVIETKLNKLLDKHDIHVSQKELDEW